MPQFDIHSTWVRLSCTRAQLDAALSPTRPKLNAALLGDLTLLQRELQDDLDLQDDIRYAAMFAALSSHLLHGHLLNRALWRPTSLSPVRAYPLYASEISVLCDILGQAVAPKTIERLALDGLISPPLLIGSSTLPRPIYFARHLLEVLYLQFILDISPSRAKAYLDVLTGRLDGPTLFYFATLPYVQPSIVKQVAAASPHRLQ